MTQTWDVVVIGGGPAGSAAAIEIAAAGGRVVLLEQHGNPRHSMCGEFLSYEALHYLRRFRVEPDRDGAQAIDRIRLVAGTCAISSRLPFPARSWTRKCLDETLLHRAGLAGASVVRGQYVHSLQKDGTRWVTQTREGLRYSATAVVLATGKHDLRGHARRHRESNGPVAFKMYFRLAPDQAKELCRYIELFLFEDGYGGMQLVEDGSANFSCLLPAHHVARCRGDGDAALELLKRACPHLCRRLQGAEALLAKPLWLSSIPYGYQAAPAEDGLWLVGDQAAVIPSFAGDGMSIALHSGVLAAHDMAAGRSSVEFQERLRRQLRPAMRFASLLVRNAVAHPSLVRCLKLWPGALAHVARRTRIPADALIQEAGAVQQEDSRT